MWELIALGALIIVGFGTAIIMALYKDGVFLVRKNKTPKVTIIRQESNGIDLEELATKVATAVASQMEEKFLDKLKELGYTAGSRPGTVVDKDGTVIEMDESIIPIAIETAADYVNLEGMATEEEKKDENLAASKNKLANLFKKKGK